MFIGDRRSRDFVARLVFRRGALERSGLNGEISMDRASWIGGSRATGGVELRLPVNLRVNVSSTIADGFRRGPDA